MNIDSNQPVNLKSYKHKTINQQTNAVIKGGHLRHTNKYILPTFEAKSRFVDNMDTKSEDILKKKMQPWQSHRIPQMVHRYKNT
ncbi:hypothetical protein CEXT_461581 [Caerostris extrusa]|uniref:Uncharacterized protein n=1 Tax=Caerostris extrusa TaxID=172846 RepID=A0AAV4X435_CAEEX|nr:hypothetical protein CEXT_461581 [Caerostris extrusa]